MFIENAYIVVYYKIYYRLQLWAGQCGGWGTMAMMRSGDTGQSLTQSVACKHQHIPVWAFYSCQQFLPIFLHICVSVKMLICSYMSGTPTACTRCLCIWPEGDLPVKSMLPLRVSSCSSNTATDIKCSLRCCCILNLRAACHLQ